ncbi:ubiquinone biosynthesis monooxygenase Coq7 [Dermatophagoides pteronyssinus]|uniref:Ubiquinone biosynthesis monooxygenase Coq7 n=2 Tax=Dermatophagoides pteronyssinus TaxID=6956 RepID=A0ABQ8JIL2_DERPT|nr:5-demethoxyubiquinone hydroxylase, mitochondrial-like [Dermatophagoides pteronyssinus]KAH9422452.1 ubiquinone biosynthesis monooxygenase Coq7 [Dermatophagoides pteronyssinus]
MAKYLTRQRKQILDSILRVDHSGELAADRIHYGLMYVFRNDQQFQPIIHHLWEQEKRHLQYFSKQLVLNRSRKSFLTPVWETLSFGLGLTSGMLGKRAAMACTVAVERTITEHYDSQIRQLLKDDVRIHQDLIENLSQIRDEEQEHHDIGQANDATKMPAYGLFDTIISNGCKVAIQIAKRI